MQRDSKGASSNGLAPLDIARIDRPEEPSGFTISIQATA